MKISETLKSIKANPKRSMSICGNIRALSKEYCFINAQIYHWPKYSGNSGFWIPATSCSCKNNPIEQYILCNKYGTFWSGEQGKLRHEALDFLIAKAEELGV